MARSSPVPPVRLHDANGRGLAPMGGKWPQTPSSGAPAFARRWIISKALDVVEEDRRVRVAGQRSIKEPRLSGMRAMAIGVWPRIGNLDGRGAGRLVNWPPNSQIDCKERQSKPTVAQPLPKPRNQCGMALFPRRSCRTGRRDPWYRHPRAIIADHIHHAPFMAPETSVFGN